MKFLLFGLCAPLTSWLFLILPTPVLSLFPVPVDLQGPESAFSSVPLLKRVCLWQGVFLDFFPGPMWVWPG